MAAPCLLFVLLCSATFANSAVNNENVPNTFDSHESEIGAVLNYLNSEPVKVYNYKDGTLISAHRKADITELTLDVNVDCINKYPELPCSEKILACYAFVRNTPDGGSRVLNDVKCVPKPEIIIEEAPYVSSTQAAETLSNETKSIALSNEAVSSEVGEHFVAIRRNSVPCLGCPFDLNPNAEGVDELVDIALRHVETESARKHALVKVLRLQQQVVSGVKLILLAEIAPTVCPRNSQEPCPQVPETDTVTCEVIFLHKPWISRVKHVISNNCTTSQEYVKPDARKNDITNEIDVNAGETKPAFVGGPNFDRIAENGAVEDMTQARLDDLESQIIVKSDGIVDQIPSTAQSILSTQPLEDRPVICSTDPSQCPSETTPQEEYVSKSKRSRSDESLEEFNDETYRRRRAIPQLEKISPEEKGLVKNLADFAASSLDSIDDDNHKRIILQILGAKKMVGDDGVYYRLIMRMGISECLEDRPPEPDVNCRERLLENYTKICKVQVFVNDDLATPKVVKSQCQNIKRDKDNNSNRTNYSRFKREVLVGGQSAIDKHGPKVRELVKQGIRHLNTQVNKNYASVEVLSATSQVVAGVLYRAKMRISDNYESTLCDLKVWEKPWQNFQQFTVTCENGDNILDYEVNSRSKRSPNNRSLLATSEMNTFPESRVIPGGQFEVAKDEEFVTKYLEGALKQLDSESHHENKLKVHEVVSATQQVVEGHIYRIKARIVLSDCNKAANKSRNECGKLEGSEPRTCNVVVWDRLWIPNSRETNVTCEGDDHSHHTKDKARSKRALVHDTASRYGLPGGESTIPEDQELVLKYLEEGLQRLDSESDHENKLKVEKVLSATRQIVEGHLYRIKAAVTVSDCKKTESKSRNECKALDSPSPKVCHFVIWDRPWLPHGRQINVTCAEGEKYSFRNKRSAKRGLLAGIEDNPRFRYALFNEFITRYNKTYASKKEYKYRLKVFGDNLEYIKLLNTYEQGTATYGVTRFADLTRTEFSKSLGLRPDLRNENETPFAQATIPDVDIPPEFDWRQKGAVAEVKNQQQCGSCWAFSVTGNVEGQYAIKHGKLMEFSEQELVDCDSSDQGCNGGLMDMAYRAIEKLGGLETEQDYPYDAKDEKCHFNTSLVRVKLTGAVNISHDEGDMAKWLVSNGPISIAINANAMQFYFGGVSHPFRFLCNPNNLDHGVLIVGYGVHTYPLFNRTLPYWIVKNSWGKSWGEQGYYRVYRGDGTCGLNQTPSSAIVA